MPPAPSRDSGVRMVMADTGTTVALPSSVKIAFHLAKAIMDAGSRLERAEAMRRAVLREDLRLGLPIATA